MCTGVQCECVHVESECHNVMAPVLHHTRIRQRTTPSFGIFVTLPQQPGGDSVIISHYLTHLLILVYIPEVMASASNSASHTNTQDLTKRKWNKYIQSAFVYVRQ